MLNRFLCQNGTREEVTVTLAANETHTFPNRSEDMGSWTASVPINPVVGIYGNISFSINVTEQVWGPTDNVHFDLGGEDFKVGIY